MSGSRVLLVEPSSTMRYVLQKYIEDEGYTLDAVESYREATDALNGQFKSFDADYDYLLLGWPANRDGDATRLLGLLEGVDFAGLTVIVLSQDMHPDARAWVAAREHCVMVKWKDYRTVSELMNVDTAIAVPAPNVDAEVQSPPANSDIRILCVDDSASIRYALRDLLSMHGFDVHAVGSYDEALSAVRNQTYDIALLDFYLQDATGDDLCRELLAETGSEIICTILTGTYSDHIVKRSLLAGATECMFKNESSDLLLARLDALGRLIRRRRSQQNQSQKMESVIDAVAGSVLVFDDAGLISYANASARRTLGHHQAFTLVGHSVADVVNSELQSVDPGRRTRTRFSSADGDPVEVLFRSTSVRRSDGGSETIVVFRTLEEIAANGMQSEGDSTSRFLKVLTESRRSRLNGQKPSANEEPEARMLLMLDIGYTDNAGQFHPIADSEAAVDSMLDGLRQVYRRRNHVVYLDESRYGLLLRQGSEAQTYLLARKIMQLSNDIGQQIGGGTYSVNGSLLSVDQNSGLNETELLQRARQGLKLVESKGRNNALLLDLKRVLPVYDEAEEAEVAPTGTGNNVVAASNPEDPDYQV